MTTTTAGAAPVCSTCRWCAGPIFAGAPGGPSWLHTGTHRAGCGEGGLPIAEPQSPVAPAVQGALFDLPPVRGRRVGGAAWAR